MEEEYLIVQAIERRKIEIASTMLKSHSDLASAINAYSKAIKNDPELTALKRAL